MSTQSENLAATLPDGAVNTIIEPTIEVVASFEVHPGLMNIDIDYGHMRASEVLSGMDPGMEPIVKIASDTITQMRRRAWTYEDRLLTVGPVGRIQLERLSELKRSVGGAVGARAAMGLAAPAGSQQWCRTWELHSRPLPEDLPTDLT